MRWRHKSSVAAAGAARPRSPATASHWLAAVVCACLFAAAGRAHSAELPTLRKVTAGRSDGAFVLHFATSAARPPQARLVLFQRPDRLVLDLPGYRWLAASTTLAGDREVGIDRIRVGAYQGAPPTARIVFDLSAAPDRLRYRMLSSPGSGDFSIEFLPLAAASPRPRETPRPATGETPRLATAPAAARPRQGPAPRPASEASLASEPPATVEPPEPAPEEPKTGSTPPGTAAETPEGTPEAPPARPPAPAPAPAPSARHPARGAALSINLAAAYSLAAVLLIIVAAVGGICSLRRTRRASRADCLRESLLAEDPMQRLGALRALRGWPTGDLRAVRDALLAALADESAPVAAEARDLLARAFPREALLRALRRGRPHARVEAAQALAFEPADAVAEPLYAAAVSGPEPVRRAAAASLVRIAQREAVRPVLRAMSSGNERERAVAAEIIGGAGARAAAGLRRGLADPDPAVRQGAIWGLAYVRPAGTAESIGLMLSDPVAEVRATAARALGTLGSDARVVEHLLRALRDECASVQEQAAVALASFGGEHLAQLTTALDQRASEDLQVRFTPEVMEAIASAATEPFPGLERALGSLNRSFASALADALQAAGAFDVWVQRLADADSDSRDLLVAVLRAAAGAGVTEPLVRGLDSRDPRVQESCASLLGEVKHAPALRAITSLLERPEERPRLAAAQALAAIGGPEAAAALVRALQDPDARVREAAARGLPEAVRTSDTEGGPSDEARVVSAALESAVRDRSPAVRAAVAASLGRLRAEEAIHALVEMALHDSDDSVRAAAMEALGRMRAFDVLPLLMEVVNDPKPELRSRALAMFARAGDTMATDVLVRALQDPDADVRATAGRGLWEVVSQGRGELLLPYLKSPDPKVRSGIAGALGKIQAAEYAGALAAAAGDPDPHVRAAIVNAFRRTGPAAAYYREVVAARLRDGDPFVRARAAEALLAMCPDSEEMARRIAAASADPEPQVRRAAARCLVDYARRGVAGPLLELLADAQRRGPALELLTEAPEDVLHQLFDAARTAPSDIAKRAVEALSKVIAERWSVDDLQPELGSLDPAVRLGGVEALAAIRGRQATEALARILTADPAAQVRLRAAQVLAGRDDPAATSALQRALQSDPDRQVRAAAQAALAEPSQHSW